MIRILHSVSNMDRAGIFCKHMRFKMRLKVYVMMMIYI